MPRFAGFRKPHYTQVPDELFDELLPELTGAELKILLYVVRRTLGWKKDGDYISLTQLTRGIRRADGTVTDRGTGLSRETAVTAARELVRRGYLAVRAGRRGNLSYYSLRWAVDKPVDGVVGKSDHPGRILPADLVGKSDPQYTAVQQTTRKSSSPYSHCGQPPKARLNAILANKQGPLTPTLRTIAEALS
jgi:hypothetical protein